MTAKGFLALLLTAWLLPAAAGEARTHTIVPGKYAVKRIGDFRTSGKAGGHWVRPTLRKAMRAFGTPSNSFQNGSGGCVVKWKRLGLRIEFYNFGGDPRGTCHPDGGYAQSFSVEQRRKVRTWNGLRVGMTENQLVNRHPYATYVEDDEWYDDGYWLKTEISPFGDNSEYPVVSAYERGGRIWRIAGWIGGAGE
jgi:hypothetical protein